MHGGSTAVFSMLSLTMLERAPKAMLAAFLPGYALAVVLHSAFNHMYMSPKLSTMAVLFTLPPLLFVVFHRSERTIGTWLGQGFDADTKMLESITSGGFADSSAGKYLTSLKHRFKGPVVADLLCYIRLHTELALRAKGLLMMRENGFDATVDEATRDKLTEMRYLERSIGTTGRLAVMPLLHGSHKDVWQLNMLASESEASAGRTASD